MLKGEQSHKSPTIGYIRVAYNTDDVIVVEIRINRGDMIFLVKYHEYLIEWSRSWYILTSGVATSVKHVTSTMWQETANILFIINSRAKETSPCLFCKMWKRRTLFSENEYRISKLILMVICMPIYSHTKQMFCYFIGP